MKSNKLSIDFQKNQIIMTKLYAKKCADTKSEEYAHLQNVRRDYPNFQVVVREIKKNPSKRVYKGLTYEYMKNYIILHTSAENQCAALSEFTNLLLISRCQQQSLRYPTIKKWFLKKYPEIANFGKDEVLGQEPKEDVDELENDNDEWEEATEKVENDSAA